MTGEAGQIQAESGMERFVELQKVVREAINAELEIFQKKLRSLSAIVALHHLMMTFLIIGISLVAFTPAFRPVLTVYLSPVLMAYFALEDTGIFRFIAWLLTAVWIVLIAFPAGSLLRRSRGHRLKILLPYAILVNPLFLVAAQYCLTSWSGEVFTLAHLIGYTLVFWFVSLILFFILTGLMVMVSPGITTFLFLVLTSIPLDPLPWIVPSHEILVSKALQRGRETIQRWLPTALRQVHIIARHRIEGINVQTQTFSFILTALGLLGILGLVLTSEQILAIINAILSVLYQETTPNETISDIHATQAFTVFFLVIILMAYFYFRFAYIDLRIAEVIGMLCAMELEARQPGHVQPDPEPEQQQEDTAKPPPAENGVPLYLSIFFSLVYIGYRLLSRRSTR